MNLNDNRNVWAPDGREGFCLGKIVDIGSDSITVQLHNGKVSLLTDHFSINN